MCVQLYMLKNIYTECKRSSNTEFSPSETLTGPTTRLGRCGERATNLIV